MSGTPTQPTPTPTPSKTPLSEEERKNLSRKRIYWAIVIIDVCIAGLLLYEIIDLFAR
jgi:hypothetical protein